MMKRIVRASLFKTGCHETQMISQTIHNNGAQAVHPGTVSGGRNRRLGPVVWLMLCPGVSMFRVITVSPGGRTP